MAPEWPLLRIVTMPTPTLLAFWMASFIMAGPKITASPLSPSTVAVPGDSRTMRQLGVGFRAPVWYEST